MKMTSDFGVSEVASVRKESRGKDDTSSTASSQPACVKVKNHLTFSIDSLVGKSTSSDADTRIDANSADSSPHSISKSSSPISNHNTGHDHPKPMVLSKTPPATAPNLSSSISEHHRVFRNSAFVPPSISSSPSISGFMAPGAVSTPVTSGRLCWDITSVDPTAAGLWKDAMAASAMYQAAAAALYTGYPWYGTPGTPMAHSDLTRKAQLMLPHDQATMNIMASSASPIIRSDSIRHIQPSQHNPNAPGMPPGPDQQHGTFWHHHIAELLRQNGGHPIHHGRIYPGAEAGHAAASFLFSGCRKPKRIRTAFSPNQLMELESAFDKNQYVVGNERKELARRLALTETQVKVWFQNRRTKAKRMKNEDGTGGQAVAGGSSSASSSVSSKSTNDQDKKIEDGSEVALEELSDARSGSNSSADTVRPESESMEMEDERETGDQSE